MVLFLIVLRYSGEDKQESKALQSNMTSARAQSEDGRMPGGVIADGRVTNDVQVEVSLETWADA